VNVQYTVLENETVNFDVLFNEFIDINSLVLVLHSAEKFIMHFFFFFFFFLKSLYPSTLSFGKKKK
jgi:hypothetical protein